jgi:hypothetical protein
MHFRVGPARWLTEAFLGAEIWAARQGRADEPAGELGESRLLLDRPGGTCDGFTLYTTNVAAEAHLIDMRGEVAHRWEMPAGGDWPRKQGVPQPRPGQALHWERCHLYPNGDLLALCCVGIDSPYGFALVKLDRDSNLLWGYSERVHHDVCVGEDGRIYAVAHDVVFHQPSGLEALPSPYTAESLVVLSPQGKELDRVPIGEAFRDSPFLVTFLSGAVVRPADGRGQGPPGRPPPPPPGNPPPPGKPPTPPGSDTQQDDQWELAPGDVLHTNSIRVLPRSLAAKFPQFEAGQVLLSLRSPSVLAVLDVKKRSVVWAARGPWRHQHDAQFLDNGRLLLFDNLGSPRGSRVLEYDPVTQAVPWSYGGAPGALVPLRGSCQRLANGNTLLLDGPLQVTEVTAEGEARWRWGFPSAAGNPGKLSVTGVRRFRPEELPFLKGVRRARP